MALEDLTGDKYINSLNSANPVGSTDAVNSLDDHMRGVKNVLKKTLPNITGAITATQTELNTLDGILASTAELNILNGCTLETAELNFLDGLVAPAAKLNLLAGASVTTNEINRLSGVTSPIQTQLDARPTSHASIIHAGRVLLSTGSGTVAGGSGFLYSWSGGICTITHSIGHGNYTTLVSTRINLATELAVFSWDTTTITIGASSASAFNLIVVED